MEHIDAKQANVLVSGADRLPREEIDALALERLHFLVDYARIHSPYLKEKYCNLPDNYTLADIPTATRAEMTEHFDRWVCDPEITTAAVEDYVSEFENIFTPFLGKYAIISTSGTTAAPLRIVRDARHLAVHSQLMAQRYFHGPLLENVEGADAPDIKCCGLVPEGGFHSSYISFLKMKRAYEARGMGERIINIPLLTPTDEMVAALNAFQPEMIGCYPSLIHMLAYEQKAGRLHIHPKFIGCSAEKLTDENRRFISEVFGCPVNDNYCSTEGGEVAMLCPNGHLHLNSDWIILEPVDAAGHPVPPGVKSDGVLITNLACLVQPVIRYYMSDRVILYNEPCGCGLNTPYIDIEGRVEDTLIFSHEGRDIRITNAHLEMAAGHTPGVCKAQFIQRSDKDLEVRMEMLDNFERKVIMEQAKGNIEKMLGEFGLGHVCVAIVDAPMQRTKGGKLRLAFKEFK